jgi:hypothetical protein
MTIIEIYSFMVITVLLLFVGLTLNIILRESIVEKKYYFIFSTKFIIVIFCFSGGNNFQYSKNSFIKHV